MIFSSSGNPAGWSGNTDLGESPSLAGYEKRDACFTTKWILAGFAKTKNLPQQHAHGFVQAGQGHPSPWQQLKNRFELSDDDVVYDMLRKLNPEQSLKDIPKEQKQPEYNR